MDMKELDRDRGLTVFDTTQLRRGGYFAGEIK